MTKAEAKRLARQHLSEIAWDFACDPSLRDYVTEDEDVEKFAVALRELASFLRPKAVAA